MEDVKKVIYFYQLSLADGSIIIHESEGLFSTKDTSNPESDRVLINSATLIKIVDVEKAKEEAEKAEKKESEVAQVEVVEKPTNKFKRKK